ncbi:Peptidase M50B-like [Parafrankia irregularis]|uniref:Peptidase M50B-like n=2 Tax=Parafrankia TaxID=2994362 RepID=A0A0S4QKQ4_9ACTN|nr:M50 family metallopeptidase [Parafrankia irregularis]MBE3202349.1 M50 family metallopeptidase [Parafrankia sp. CH37]CUU56103.1 Peptidase M50B-like [Parafrankia irregularis]
MKVDQAWPLAATVTASAHATAHATTSAAAVAAATTDLAPSPSTGLSSGLVALALVIARPLWNRTGHLNTAAHEGGHALMAFLLDREFLAVRLEANQNGLTSYFGRPRGFGRMIISASGYTAPSLFGLAAAALLAAGNVTAAFLLAGLALCGLLLLVVNAFGRLTVVVMTLLLVLVTARGSAGSQLFVACAVSWFLLLGAIRSLGELRQARRYSLHTDADTLASVSHLPAWVWVAIFYTIDLYCLLLGGRLLLGG